MQVRRKLLRLVELQVKASLTLLKSTRLLKQISMLPLSNRQVLTKQYYRYYTSSCRSRSKTNTLNNILKFRSQTLLAFSRQTIKQTHSIKDPLLLLSTSSELPFNKLEKMPSSTDVIIPSALKQNLLSSCDKYLQLFNQQANRLNINLMLPSLSFFTRTMSTYQKTINTSNGKMVASKANESSILDPKGVKHMKINACGELYKELSRTKPMSFGSAPKGKGIDFDLDYYDTYELLEPTKRSEAPVVCLLHGAPGHFKDFERLIEFLNEKGFRVIAPTFPDYSVTFKHSFRHSPRERVEYLHKFFQSLEIKELDMLIGHSGAVFTLFELLNQNLDPSRGEQERLIVKSLGLISTPSYNLPPNMAVTPFRLFTLKLFDYPLLRPIILALIHIFVQLQGIRNKVDKSNIENLLVSASVVGYSDNEKMKDQLKLVHKYSIPTFLMFGCSDRLIPLNSFEQLKRDLGAIDRKQVKKYDKNGELLNNENDLDSTNRDHQHLVQVSQFESGGHYAFQKFFKQVNEDIYEFLVRKVLRKKQPVESTHL